MATQEATRQLRFRAFPEVRKWLYALGPRDAMLLACDPAFQKFLSKKREETKWTQWINGILGLFLD